MTRTLKYTFLAAAASLAAACSHDKTDTPCPPSGSTPICWDIHTDDGAAHSTRTLIGDDDSGDAYCRPLSWACTPVAEQGPGYAIGIFGDYTYTDVGRSVTESDIFSGTRLVYSAAEGGNPYSAWNYEGEDLYWYPGGQYVFRAYYPQRMHNYTVSTSNATTLAIVYPTRDLQYDLLLGYATADTTLPDTMSQPVNVTLRHALSALRFRFRLGFADEDKLTSCFLLNDEERKFCSYGIVVYGSETDPESIKWRQNYNPKETDETYKWVHRKGLPMKTVRISGISEKVERYEYTCAEAYTYDAQAGIDAEVETGELYCRNSGWILIVPQESHGKTYVCFTTEKGGATPYKVLLPTVTECDDVGNTVSTEWEAGKRYTYTITLSKTDVDVDLTIEDWNQRKHSTEIIF